MSIDISKLSAADLATIIAHARMVEAAEVEARKAEVAARKAERTKSLGFLAKFVRVLTNGADGIPAEQTFKSGAKGWSLGGKNVGVQLADGTVRMARVSILVRWEDTIPATDTDA